MKTTQSVTLFLAVFTITGCKTFDPVFQAQKRRDTSLEALRAINVSDGVDDKEARLWAGEYAAKYIPKQVTLGFARDQGDDWAVDLYIGEGTRLNDTIYVNKKTGKMSCGEYPVVEKPWEEFTK